MKIGMFLFLFSLSFSVFAKTKSVKLASEDVSTSVVGSFQKHDSGFMYLKVKGAKNLVKVPNKYSLNHPSNYNKGLLLKLDLPLSVFMTSNLKGRSVKGAVSQ